MKLTKLSLTNFRSFGETQSIEFAPVTLLFGPNSVGKSTVLMALFYVQQILAKGQCNPQRLDALGHKFVGGFKSLVHGKKTDKTIKIKIEYTKGERIGSNYTSFTEFLSDEACIELNSPASEAKTMAVELEIAWSDKLYHSYAYVAAYRVWFDHIEIARVTSDAGLKQPMLTWINYLHPLLLTENHDDCLYDYCYGLGEKIHNAWRKKVLEMLDATYAKILSEKGIDSSNHRKRIEDLQLEDELLFSDNGFVSELHQLINKDDFDQNSLSTIDIDHHSLIHKPIGIKGFVGALPLLNQPLKSTLSLDDMGTSEVVNEILSDVLVAPLDNLLSLLNESLCIGPLRHIPDTTYQPNPYPQQADWYSGKACWDTLAVPDLIKNCTVNHWLEDRDKLNLGYKLVYKVNHGETRYISPTLDVEISDDALALHDAFPNQLKITVSKENLEDNPDAHQTPIDNDSLNTFRDQYDSESSLYIGGEGYKNTEITLWDTQNNIEVTAADIGVGMSQLLPLVVATLTRKKGLIACEQPELHVHPRVQVAIGDLLTQANAKASFLIETHSEHLILRLLRRIRETTDNELPEGHKPVTTNDVSIVYLEPSENGVSVKKLEVNEDGEFTSRWPQGFFSERREELF